MTKHVGWLGLLLGLALVPSACGSDDDDTGTGGAGAPSAGKGGGSNAGKSGGSNAGKGGGSNAGTGGSGGAAGEPSTAGQGGQSGDGGDGPTEPIEIAGTWKNDDFDETDIIDSDSWSQDYGAGPVVTAIVEYSNSENYAVRQAPNDASFDAGKFDRVVWTEIDGDTFYYCTPDHGLDTAEEAASSSTPVDADDLQAGCDGFSWTQLTVK